MIKLSADTKYGCPKCKYDQERTKIKEIKSLAFLIDESTLTKQTTLNPPKKNTSNKLTTLF